MNQSVRLKEEQLRREEEKVFLTYLEAGYVIAHQPLSLLQIREIELRVQREINEKRQELMAKETALRLVFGVFVTFSRANTAPSETWRLGSHIKEEKPPNLHVLRYLHVSWTIYFW